MKKQDRATLKSFFRSGALPTEREYADLIESMVNKVDDGFSRTDEDGWRLNSIGSKRVMSLYKGLGAKEPSWVVDHDDKEGALHFRPDLGERALGTPKAPTEKDGTPKTEDAGAADQAAGRAPAQARTNTPTSRNPAGQEEAATDQLFRSNLTLTNKGRVGIHCEEPEWRLDVDGVARMKGRIGHVSPKIPHVPADGGWHSITQEMTGCQILEVTAGTGGAPKEGRYSLLHAVAMNAYQPQGRFFNWFFRRRSIKAQTAMYGRYSDRLQLRWINGTEPHTFRLQIRSHAHFGTGRFIRYNVTRLWFDTYMTGALLNGDRDEGLS